MQIYCYCKKLFFNISKEALIIVFNAVNLLKGRSEAKA